MLSPCAFEDYLSMKPTLERLILREIKRRCDAGLSLVSEDLTNGSEEEFAFLSTATRLFGNWKGALRSSDVAWDGRGLATTARSY